MGEVLLKDAVYRGIASHHEGLQASQIDARRRLVACFHLLFGELYAKPEGASTTHLALDSYLSPHEFDEALANS
jgi:hypothetical protein